MQIDFIEADENEGQISTCELDFVPQIGSTVAFNFRGAAETERYRVLRVEHQFRWQHVKVDGVVHYQDVLDRVVCWLEELS